MDVVLCPGCGMAWEYDCHASIPVLSMRCTCGGEFIPKEVLSMPRTPHGPGLTPEPNLMRALDTLKTREGDQPLPTESDSPSMHDLVCEDMQGRKAVGLSRYGRALQANNGRDGMRDAYEEALDLCAYLRQLLYERDGR